MDWRTAYLEQAKSDYAMLLKLNREAAPLIVINCTTCR